jgi:hypothetical protein
MGVVTSGRLDITRMRMKRHPSFGESLQADEYDWIESRLRTRAPDDSQAGLDDSASIAVESDLLRTILFTFVLGGLSGLLAYFAFRVASGGGRSIFLVTATVGTLLGCGAVACRRRIWLRFLLVLCSLCAFALLVDQVVYYRWQQRIDGLVTTVRKGIESGPIILPNPLTVRPTSFLINADRQEILLTFEPPPLAWTYRLASTSSIGRALVSGWYRFLSSVTQGRHLTYVARTVVHPHEVYSLGVKSDAQTLVCQEGETGKWTLSIQTRPGNRPL